MNRLQIISSGIVKNNPTFVLVLGMCPTLGTTTSAENGMGMGLATMAVLIMSNLVISLIKNIIPDKVRIPAFIVVIASFVTIIQMLMQAYVPALPGKEARKAEPGKEGLLGVEGVPDALILQGLTTALESAVPRADAAKSRAITYTDLYDWGISGTANSAENRRALLHRLGLPPRLSKKELLQVLNTLYTYDALCAEIKNL